MNWKTRITQITETKYPLIMAAFAGLGKTKFAASFSNAGGLGIITALNYKLDDFKYELNKMRDLTIKQLYNMYLLYVILERPLFHYVGNEREKSNYCLPFFQAQRGLYGISYKRMEGSLYEVSKYSCCKYSAFNYCKIFRRSRN